MRKRIRVNGRLYEAVGSGDENPLRGLTYKKLSSHRYLPISYDGDIKITGGKARDDQGQYGTYDETSLTISRGNGRVGGILFRLTLSVDIINGMCELYLQFGDGENFVEEVSDTFDERYDTEDFDEIIKKLAKKIDLSDPDMDSSYLKLELEKFGKSIVRSIGDFRRTRF